MMKFNFPIIELSEHKIRSNYFINNISLPSTGCFKGAGRGRGGGGTVSGPAFLVAKRGHVPKNNKLKIEKKIFLILGRRKKQERKKINATQLTIINFINTTGKQINTPLLFLFLRGFPEKPKHLKHIFAENILFFLFRL